MYASKSLNTIYLTKQSKQDPYYPNYKKSFKAITLSFRPIFNFSSWETLGQIYYFQFAANKCIQFVKILDKI